MMRGRWRRRDEMLAENKRGCDAVLLRFRHERSSCQEQLKRYEKPRSSFTTKLWHICFMLFSVQIFSPLVMLLVTFIGTNAVLGGGCILGRHRSEIILHFSDILIQKPNLGTT